MYNKIYNIQSNDSPIDSLDVENNSNEIIESSVELKIDNNNNIGEKSILKIITDKSKNQDFKQRVGITSTLVVEIYRLIMGCFLVILVPQKCNDNICSITENINRNDYLTQLTIKFNIITICVFLLLYMIELKRENKLITYLEVNKYTPVDNESVGKALEKLPIDKKENILKIDNYYKTAGYISTVSFIGNSILSYIVVYSNYLDSKTMTVYLTNVLFIGLKVSEIFSTVNTKQNVFYSAYLINKVQFNDVDPDQIIQCDIYETPDIVEELSHETKI